MLLRNSSLRPCTASLAARTGTLSTGASVWLRRRGLATVHDAHSPPKKTQWGGLRDQDRIFQNLYGRQGADLASARKIGDWHRTKDIILKGDDWVSAASESSSEAVLTLRRSYLKSRLPACVDAGAPGSHQD
jgi:NADH dehydrogenase (ubiquinone) flavoprotein 1